MGKLLIKSPQIRGILREWGKREHVLRRRMAVVPYLELSMHGQYRPEYASLLFEAVTPHLGDPEFFVGKAVGWVLRQLSYHEPGLVRRFVAEKQFSNDTAGAPRERSKALKPSSLRLG